MGRKSKKKKKKSPAKQSASVAKAASSKKSAATKNSPRVLASHLEARESQSAVASTVAWLLSALATLLALIVSVVAQLIYQQNGSQKTLAAIHMMLFSAVVTGIVTLVLTKVVHSARKTAPPKNVTIGAVTIGLVPLLVYALMWLKG